MSSMALLRCSQSVRLLAIQQARLITTSRKNRETATVAEEVEKVEKAEAECKVKKNWVSYGFHHSDETEDLNAMHSTTFGAVTLCIVFGGFFWAYMPDFRLQNWAQREGYLELRRREALGLPLVDRNFIDPEKIILPSDEELDDTEIII